MIIVNQQFPRSKAEVQAATEAVTEEASQVELLSEIVLDNMHILIYSNISLCTVYMCNCSVQLYVYLKGVYIYICEHSLLSLLQM